MQEYYWYTNVKNLKEGDIVDSRVYCDFKKYIPETNKIYFLTTKQPDENELDFVYNSIIVTDNPEAARLLWGNKKIYILKPYSGVIIYNKDVLEDLSNYNENKLLDIEELDAKTIDSDSKYNEKLKKYLPVLEKVKITLLENKEYLDFLNKLEEDLKNFDYEKIIKDFIEEDKIKNNLKKLNVLVKLGSDLENEVLEDIIQLIFDNIKDPSRLNESLTAFLEKKIGINTNIINYWKELIEELSSYKRLPQFLKEFYEYGYKNISYNEKNDKEILKRIDEVINEIDKDKEFKNIKEKKVLTFIQLNKEEDKLEILKKENKELLEAIYKLKAEKDFENSEELKKQVHEKELLLKNNEKKQKEIIQKIKFKQKELEKIDIELNEFITLKKEWSKILQICNSLKEILILKERIKNICQIIQSEILKHYKIIQKKSFDEYFYSYFEKLYKNNKYFNKLMQYITMFSKKITKIQDVIKIIEELKELNDTEQKFYELALQNKPDEISEEDWKEIINLFLKKKNIEKEHKFSPLDSKFIKKMYYYNNNKIDEVENYLRYLVNISLLKQNYWYIARGKFVVEKILEGDKLEDFKEKNQNLLKDINKLYEKQEVEKYNFYKNSSNIFLLAKATEIANKLLSKEISPTDEKLEKEINKYSDVKNLTIFLLKNPEILQKYLKDKEIKVEIGTLQEALRDKFQKFQSASAYINSKKQELENEINETKEDIKRYEKTKNEIIKSLNPLSFLKNKDFEHREYIIKNYPDIIKKEFDEVKKIMLKVLNNKILDLKKLILEYEQKLIRLNQLEDTHEMWELFNKGEKLIDKDENLKGRSSEVIFDIFKKIDFKLFALKHFKERIKNIVDKFKDFKFDIELNLEELITEYSAKTAADEKITSAEDFYYKSIADLEKVNFDELKNKKIEGIENLEDTIDLQKLLNDFKTDERRKKFLELKSLINKEIKNICDIFKEKKYDNLIDLIDIKDFIGIDYENNLNEIIQILKKKKEEDLTQKILKLKEIYKKTEELYYKLMDDTIPLESIDKKINTLKENKEKLESIKFFLPDLDEKEKIEKRIKEILDDIKTLKENKKKLQYYFYDNLFELQDNETEKIIDKYKEQHLSQKETFNKTAEFILRGLDVGEEELEKYKKISNLFGINFERECHATQIVRLFPLKVRDLTKLEYEIRKNLNAELLLYKSANDIELLLKGKAFKQILKKYYTISAKIYEFIQRDNKYLDELLDEYEDMNERAKIATLISLKYGNKPNIAYGLRTEIKNKCKDLLQRIDEYKKIDLRQILYSCLHDSYNLKFIFDQDIRQGVKELKDMNIFDKWVVEEILSKKIIPVIDLNTQIKYINNIFSNLVNAGISAKELKEKLIYTEGALFKRIEQIKDINMNEEEVLKFIKNFDKDVFVNIISNIFELDSHLVSLIYNCFKNNVKDTKKNFESLRIALKEEIPDNIYEDIIKMFKKYIYVNNLKEKEKIKILFPEIENRIQNEPEILENLTILFNNKEKLLKNFKDYNFLGYVINNLPFSDAEIVKLTKAMTLINELKKEIKNKVFFEKNKNIEDRYVELLKVKPRDYNISHLKQIIGLRKKINGIRAAHYKQEYYSNLKKFKMEVIVLFEKYKNILKEIKEELFEIYSRALKNIVIIEGEKVINTSQGPEGVWNKIERDIKNYLNKLVRIHYDTTLINKIIHCKMFQELFSLLHNEFLAKDKLISGSRPLRLKTDGISDEEIEDLMFSYYYTPREAIKELEKDRARNRKNRVFNIGKEREKSQYYYLSFYSSIKKPSY